MTPEQIAELAFEHLHQGAPPDAWRRFWARLAVLTGSTWAAGDDEPLRLMPTIQAIDALSTPPLSSRS